MISRIEAKNYRSLLYVSQEVKPFQILIGPNASGKSTFLDVVAFIGDIVKYGVKVASEKRSQNFNDLTFNRMGGPIELAVEIRMAGEYITFSDSGNFNDPNSFQILEAQNYALRYEIRLEQPKNSTTGITGERLLLLNKGQELEMYSSQNYPFEAVYEKITKRVYKALITRSSNQMVSIKSHSGKNALPGYMLDGDKTALSSVIEDRKKFIEPIWVREFLSKEVKIISLDGDVLRKASHPGQGLEYATNGSNLPWVVENIRENYPDLFLAWLQHVQIGLPDVRDIAVRPVPDLNQRYLQIEYKNGARIPSWLLSDGTLRFLALTVLAYLPHDKGFYLIEEPENGVHPKILESVYQSLSSVYGTQIMLATHSPLFLSIAGEKALLLFTKGEEGQTLITEAINHPYLMEWNQKIDLGSVFASGVLG